MSGKHVRFFVSGQERVLPVDDFRAYMANLSDAAKGRITFPEGLKHDSVYENTEGELARESLSGEQIVRRSQLGEDVLVTGAEDPKLQAHMRQQAAKARKEAAADEGVIAAFNGINLLRMTGLPQALESAYFGEEEAIRIHNEIAEANPGETFFGNMALGLGMGGFVGGALRGLGIAAKTGKGLGLAAHMFADEAAFETALYTKHIMDQRKDFQAEELGANIVQGMMFTTPVLAGALLRKPVWAALKMGGNAGMGGLGLVRDALVFRGLQTGDRSLMGKAAGLGALERVHRRLFGGRKTVTKVDELAELRKVAAKEEQYIGRATPEGLRNAKGGKLEEILGPVKKYMDEGASKLDDIDYNGMARKIGAVRTAHRQAVQEIGRAPRNMRVGKVRGVSRIGKESTQLLESSMDTFLGRAESMGYDDFVGHLRDVKGHEQYGRLFQARLDMALKAKSGRHNTGILADELKAISEDPRIWGTGKMAEQARNLNDAIDDFVTGYERLDSFNLPDDLSKIPDNVNYSEINDAIGDIRRATDRIHASGLYSFDDLRAVSSRLDKIEDALIEGGQATIDAKTLNKARKTAAINHKKNFEALKSGDVEDIAALDARMEARVEETSKKRTKLMQLGEALVKSGRLPIYNNRLLRAVRESSMEEKTALFEAMHEKVNMLLGSPDHMAVELEPFMVENPLDPEMHTMAGVNASNSVYFLASKLGRTDRTLYGRNRAPRRDRVLRFAETFAAMSDPWEVGFAALSGEVTQDMVDAVRITAPAQYAEISNVLSAVVNAADPDTLPRRSAAGINKFLGGMDPLYSGQVIMQLQSNYAQNAEQQAATGGIAGQFNQTHPQDGDNAFTFTQRLMSY